MDRDRIGYRSGRLWVEGIPAESIARSAGTPVYVYSAGVLRDRYRALAGAFAGRPPLICYALKANPNRAVCRVLAAEGAGADVVSGGELRRALAAGIPPSKIVFSGVGKTGAELALAVRAGILAVHVESGEELQALSRQARRLGRVARFSVRLNPDVDAGTHRHIATGRAGDKFGLDARDAVALYGLARRDRRLEAAGLHCHIGSQVLRVGPYVRALSAALDVALRLARGGLRLRYLDLGGGMGVPYGGEPPLALGKLAKAVTAALEPWPGLDLLIEPGRYLAADAGILLTRVLYRKRTGRRRFVVVDAGMNDFLRPALYGARHPIVLVRRAAGGTPVDVVGPVCESADVLGKERRLGPSRPGDLLAVLKAGAYGFSMASQYNSRPRPAEVLVDGRASRVVRRRETFEDLIRHEG